MELNDLEWEWHKQAYAEHIFGLCNHAQELIMKNLLKKKPSGRSETTEKKGQER